MLFCHCVSFIFSSTALIGPRGEEKSGWAGGADPGPAIHLKYETSATVEGEIDILLQKRQSHVGAGSGQAHGPVGPSIWTLLNIPYYPGIN